MTCLLNTYGFISNLNNIIQFLNESSTSLSINADTLSNKSDEKSQKDFINDWDWEQSLDSEKESEFRRSEKSTFKDKKESWLESFHISCSPCGNLMVIANKTNIVICQGKWLPNNQIKYTISSRIDLKENTKEFVTTILCIPIASQKISGEGLLDWTCILVGFNTGNLRMYTENGILLMTQMFHDEKIVSIKCRTYEPARYIGWITQPEEIEILYNNNVFVCIDGTNLYHYLRAARKYTANSLASGVDHDMSDMIASLSLDYKKWRLDNHEILADFVSAGLTSENRFDQLFAASMIGGPNEKFESIPPSSNRYLTTGNGPYVQFYYAIEGLSVPVFTEVKAVAGKVTSALMNAAKGWMGFNRSQSSASKPKPKIEPPTILPSRFGLRDQRRIGESIIMAPANNLAATTDSFARVILIDVFKGIAVRIFKGYRDAQIGWICVDDESEEKNIKRYALYLIIYAPRRGLLEVWGCQQGIRVAAFNVGKYSKLIYPGYYMLSLNGSLLNDQVKTNSKIQCFLIDSDGIVKTIQIPFHLILSDKSNQRVRDTILLKKFKSILREESKENDLLWNNLNLILKDFKTPTIKQQALERMINTSYLSPNKLFDILSQQLDQIEQQGNYSLIDMTVYVGQPSFIRHLLGRLVPIPELTIRLNQGENQSPDSLKLGHFCRFNCKLIYSYIFVCGLGTITAPTTTTGTNQEDSSNENDDKDSTSNLSQLMQIDEEDFKKYFEIKSDLSVKYQKQKRIKQPIWTDSKHFDLTKYLTSFEYTTNANLINHKYDYSKQRFFELSNHVSFKDKQLLACFLFSPFLQSSTSRYDALMLKNFLTSIPLKKIQLLDLLVIAWLSQSFENISNLYKLIFVLSGCSNYTMNTDYEPMTPVNDETNNVLKLYENKPSDEESNEYIDDIDFENNFISEYLPKFKAICENSESLLHSLLLTWIFRSILVQTQFETVQVEILSVLSDRLFSLLKLYGLLLIGTKSYLDTIEPESFNLRRIFARGKGFLTEILSKHIVLNEFPPKLLIVNDELEEGKAESNGQELLKNELYNQFYVDLQEARDYLPKSFETDSLLANSAWESTILFSKNHELNIDYLELSLRYCGDIGNAILKQGILSMIWHNHITKRLSALTDLIDKVGKTPKDRQLKKEVGLSETNLIKFLDCIMTLLDLIMDANCNINEVPIFNYDQFWSDHNADYNELSSISTNMILNLTSKNHSNFKNDISSVTSTTLSTNTTISSSSSSSSSSKQLVELAAEQKHVNYHLCLFHYHLIRILYLIVKYNMKPVRPLSFFDTKGKHTLFSELHTHPLISNDVDIKIMNARKFFFTRAMNSIMENVENPTNIKSKLPKEINDNLNIIFNLSKDMGVDLEYIKRYYCCMLYALDYHSEAEKILHTLKERELMASQLLVVVGWKINEILNANFDASLVAILSTNLTSWLKSLGSSEYRIYTIASKQPLLELMGCVLKDLPDTFSQYKLAVELFDFIENSQFQIK